MELKIYKDVLMRTIHFMRLHYLHLLPFSFVLFVLLLLVGFVSVSSNKLSILILAMVSPLLFSFAFYVHRFEHHGENTWKNFINIYADIVRYYKVQGLKYFLFLIALLPMIVVLQIELAAFGFDLELFYHAEKSGSYLPSPYLYLTTFFSVTLTMLCYPFVIFPEYFYIFEKLDIKSAYKKSFDLAKHNYFSLLFLMVIQIIIFSLGSFLSCGFLFVLALPFFSILTYYIYSSWSARLS
ncbi:MAG: hypothetical protein ACK5UE_00390 [Chitinophagales bacterium]|jgi:hypothetical protein|nr:hypothetical protein [Sphingobacteriales bacterium]